jgi:hypothetical protein
MQKNGGWDPVLQVESTHDMTTWRKECFYERPKSVLDKIYIIEFVQNFK